MHRRPWPIVLLALFQLFTPVGSIFFTALASHVGFLKLLSALIHRGSIIDHFMIFYVPILLGILIYFTKKIGLYLVIFSTLVNFILNLMEWMKSGDTSQLWMLITVSLLNIALVTYLLLPSVREIFLNPAVRWWEHAPRYVMNLPAFVLKHEVETSCYLLDISIGGASLECAPGAIFRGDIVFLKFHYQERTIGIQCEVMYERSIIDSEFSVFGLRKLAGSLTGESLMIQELIDELKAAKIPVTRPDSDTKQSLLSWAKKAAKDPTAWVPESTRSTKNKKN